MLKTLSDFFRLRTLREKIMLSMVCIALFSILGTSVISLSVSRNLMLQNAEQLMQDVVAQISINLDERVKNYQETSYAIFTSTRLQPAFAEEPASTSFIEAQFNNEINLNSFMYTYTDYAYFRTDENIYYYTNYSERTLPELSVIENQLASVENEVDKLHPTGWFNVDGEVVFARLIVDEVDFSTKGLAVFVLKPTFLNFVNQGNTNLLIENYSILESDGRLLFSDNTSLKDVDYLGLLDAIPKNNNIRSSRENIEGETYLVSSAVSPTQRFEINLLITESSVYRNDRIVVFLNILIGIVAVVLAVILTLVLSRSIMQNVTRLKDCMSRMRQGDFSAQMRPDSYDEIGDLGLQFNYMSARMQELIDNISEEKSGKQRAEFQVLQAQVNPHFLYNTLGSVKWLANKHGYTEVERMVDALVNLLKGSIRTVSSFQKLSDEIEYLENYFYLQQKRYGDCFSVEYEVDEGTTGLYVPGFLLQPIVENSLFHGIDISQNSGVIRVKSRIENSRLKIEVSDNGKGMTDEKIKEILNKPKQYKGYNSIGVNIVKDRILNLYEGKATFDIESTPGRGTVTKISIPINENEVQGD